MFTSKNLCGPVYAVIHGLVGRYGFGIPRIMHDEVDGDFLRFQVTNVYNPKFIDTRLVGQIELLAQFGNSGGVHPTVVPWTSVHINVIVQSASANPILFFNWISAAYVAPVVVAK